jgi:hypothetical protein
VPSEWLLLGGHRHHAPQTRAPSRALVEIAASDGGVPILNQAGMAVVPFRFPKSPTEPRGIVARLDAMRGKVDELPGASCRCPLAQLDV